MVWPHYGSLLRESGHCSQVTTYPSRLYTTVYRYEGEGLAKEKQLEKPAISSLFPSLLVHLFRAVTISTNQIQELLWHGEQASWASQPGPVLRPCDLLRAVTDSVWSSSAYTF